MTLNELKVGNKAKILKIENLGKLKKRLMDMGITKGEVIKYQRNAPLGDPKEFIIKNTTICIRKSDASNIYIKEI
ncbi:ferrous iron transport protein A [Hypnocyclicus thermotrophus]|uniref:Ferrous iron transport protein A n=1 Tax=Hypnocyclicus thermotrophus TaxID=1627895 RepID=A0AA46I764_9FUSO|nr:ferrous iron transport protein A [Hypnocyclicus thermotrophus]TDT72368.1 ferrous iron transport protein A [Hypnocyclicus thermotrophus]